MRMILLLALSCAINSQFGRFINRGWGVGEKAVQSEDTFGSADFDGDLGIMRLEPKYRDAVYAMFEAWFERSYYTSVGPSNNWDTSVFGTRYYDDLHEIPWHYFDDEISDYNPSFEYVDEDTGTPAEHPHVPSTFRLVEYRNTNRLADLFKGSCNLGDVFALRRPGWRTDYYTDKACEWSSTAFDDCEGEETFDDLPEFEWTTAVAGQEFKTSYTNWCRTAVKWSNLKSGEGIDLTGGSDETIICKMLEKVACGYPPCFTLIPKEPWDEHIIPRHWKSSTTTTFTVISNQFDRADEFEHIIKYPIVFNTNHSTSYLTNTLSTISTNFPLTVTVPPIKGGLYHWEENDETNAVEVNTHIIVTDANGEEYGIFDSIYSSYYKKPKGYADCLGGGGNDRTNTFFYTTNNFYGNVGFKVSDLDILIRETNYLCKANAITNGTIRLYTDRLAALDQVLSVCDRTYAHVDLDENYTPLEKHDYTGKIMMESDRDNPVRTAVDLHFEFNTRTGEYELVGTNSVKGLDMSQHGTNMFSDVKSIEIGERGTLVASVSKSTQSFKPNLLARQASDGTNPVSKCPLVSNLPTFLDKLRISSPLGSGYARARNISAVFMPTGKMKTSIEWAVHSGGAEGGSFTTDYESDVYPLQAEFDVYAFGTYAKSVTTWISPRDYGDVDKVYSWTDDGSGRLIHHPAAEIVNSANVVKDYKMYKLAGIRLYRGDQYHPVEEYRVPEFDTNMISCLSSEYKLEHGVDLFSEWNIGFFMQDVMDRCISKAAFKWDAQSAVNISASDLGSILNAIKNGSFGLNARFAPFVRELAKNYLIGFENDGETCTLTGASYIGEDGTIYPADLNDAITNTAASIGFSGTEYEIKYDAEFDNASYGACANAKLDFYHKVDWNWKALNRKKDDDQ